MSSPSLQGESSKVRQFLKSLLPHRQHDSRPIHLDSRPIHVDGLSFVPDDVKSKKILIIDDDAVILKTLSLKLQGVGYQVVTGADGADAIRAVREEQPDLILLDIDFPPDVSHGGGVPWDGFLIMGWVRRIDGAQNIPIIMITSGDPAKYKERALAEGAHSFFHKPIEMPELMSTIQQILGTEPPKSNAGFDI